MIKEERNGYSVPVIGGTEFIPARTLVEAEGVVSGLAGMKTTANPHPDGSPDYWRWECGRDKAELFLASRRFAPRKMRTPADVLSKISMFVGGLWLVFWLLNRAIEYYLIGR